MKLRIVLADDHPFVLLGIRAAFSMGENLEVIAEAASAAELLRLLVLYTPCDVLVTDFAMPEQGLQAEDGLRLIKRLRRDWPAISIIVLTSMSKQRRDPPFNSGRWRNELAQQGRVHGLTCGRGEVCRRWRYPSTSIVSALAVAGAETDALGDDPRLSPREIEVVRMFASELSITEIPRFMKRDIRTISRQKRDVASKLGVQNDPGLFAFARAWTNVMTHIAKCFRTHLMSMTARITDPSAGSASAGKLKPAASGRIIWANFRLEEVSK